MIVLPPRTGRPRDQSVSSERSQLIEIHALVLPERVVFRDKHRALQFGRDAAVPTQYWIVAVLRPDRAPRDREAP